MTVIILSVLGYLAIGYLSVLLAIKTNHWLGAEEVGFYAFSLLLSVYWPFVYLYMLLLLPILFIKWLTR